MASTSANFGSQGILAWNLIQPITLFFSEATNYWTLCDWLIDILGFYSLTSRNTKKVSANVIECETLLKYEQAKVVLREFYSK